MQNYFSPVGSSRYDGFPKISRETFRKGCNEILKDIVFQTCNSAYDILLIDQFAAETVLNHLVHSKTFDHIITRNLNRLAAEMTAVTLVSKNFALTKLAMLGLMFHEAVIW